MLFTSSAQQLDAYHRFNMSSIVAANIKCFRLRFRPL